MLTSCETDRTDKTTTTNRPPQNPPASTRPPNPPKEKLPQKAVCCPVFVGVPCFTFITSFALRGGRMGCENVFRLSLKSFSFTITFVYNTYIGIRRRRGIWLRGLGLHGLRLGLDGRGRAR